MLTNAAATPLVSFIRVVARATHYIAADCAHPQAANTRTAWRLHMGEQLEALEVTCSVSDLTDTVRSQSRRKRPPLCESRVGAIDPLPTYSTALSTAAVQR